MRNRFLDAGARAGGEVGASLDLPGFRSEDPVHPQPPNYLQSAGLTTVGIDKAVLVPEQASFVDLRTREEWVFPFNPPQIQEKIGASRTKANVVGHSHQPSQFAGTTTRVLTFSLFVHRVALRKWYPDSYGQAGSASDPVLDLVRKFRQWLLSLCHPEGLLEDGQVGGDQPRVALLWPNHLTLTGYVTSVNVTHESFSSNGSLRSFTADVTFEREYNGFRKASEMASWPGE